MGNKELLNKVLIVLSSIIVIFFVAVFVMARVNREVDVSFDVEEDVSDEVTVLDEFELPAAPDLQDVSFGVAPLFYFLFTHTEDPFNHELSEDRYWKVGEMVEDFASNYPTVPISWTIEFMGSDANTIADRNEETGLVEYLKDLNAQGLVDFGYHAHHDPTYLNRPQTALSQNMVFEEVYDALYSWMTCKKDVLRGGCIQDDGGGLLAIQDIFGSVSMVTGVGVGTGVLIERSAGSMALRELLPDRWVGFGFADHGASTEITSYQDLKSELMTILTPTHDTSSYSFWMDNAIRLNDGGLNTIDGVKKTQNVVDAYERDRPQLLNVGIASKYHYTATGTSPTKWGYSHPDDPELPQEQLVSDSQIKKNYVFTNESMDYLMEWLEADDTGSAFVNSEEILDLFTSEDYWSVSEDELYNVALWLLNDWEEQTPNWAYDGEDYYSLTDAFVLLAHGLQGTFDELDVVSRYYGPWSLGEIRTQASEMEVETLKAWVMEWDDEMIDEVFKIDGVSFTASQVLYALAHVYLLEHDGLMMESIVIPEMINAPETYSILEDLGCSDCLDSSWSLKPARFQDLGGVELF
jgi:hypothetical protein